MPTRTKGRRPSRQRRALNRRITTEADVPAVGTTFLVRNQEVTHAVIPMAEYERSMSERQIISQTAVFEDDDGPWVDAEDAFAQLAAKDIVKARKKAGLTQAQLAAKVKMPQSQISRIERNPDRTTVRTLKKIAKALGVDVRYLL